MAQIAAIKGRQILDSRGLPTVEVDVILSSGVMGRASVPSGASKGLYEVSELRDGGSRYAGFGVQKALDNLDEICAYLLGQDVRLQKGIDLALITLDGTLTKSRLGANMILAVSMAAARAAAIAVRKPLFEYLNTYYRGDDWCTVPLPLINVINGGVHADNRLDFQEFMIMPVGAASFSEAIRYGVEVFQALKSLLKQKGLGVNVGDEGGFAPNLPTHEAAIECILSAVEQAGFKAGVDIALALDLASSAFVHPDLRNVEAKTYVLPRQRQSFSTEDWIEYLASLVWQYPIWSLEDPMAEQDWAGWQALNQRLGHSVQLVGDDLLVTNSNLIEKAIDLKAVNAVLIKANQIGTLTETREAILSTARAGFQTIISHRSGETEDHFIADFAVGCGASQIKAGAVCRGERTAKYNQLLRIEESLGARGRFVGLRAFKTWGRGG